MKVKFMIYFINYYLKKTITNKKEKINMLETILTVLFCGWVLTISGAKSNLSGEGQRNVEMSNSSYVRVVNVPNTGVIK